MFRRLRHADASDWQVQDLAGHLRRTLAVTGPHDDRIGHHRTQEPNTDPHRIGLAVAGRPAAPVTQDQGRGRVLRLPAVQVHDDEMLVSTASHRR